MRGDARLRFSLVAVAVGLAICLHQRHFVVSVTEPLSFVRMLRHKCGLVMAGAVMWAAAEMVLGVARWCRGWVAETGKGVPSVLRG